jgi:hypothetical protein
MNTEEFEDLYKAACALETASSSLHEARRYLKGA